MWMNTNERPASSHAGDHAHVIRELQAQLRELTRRLERLESGSAPASRPPTEPPGPAVEITEAEIIAISAALAAYLGVRPRVRQIRLLSSAAWAQQGRVSIQASHHLMG
jgi:methylmalonyl-CoA carboxyltransferase large subunit